MPITNSISTGIALLSWGAEDGKNGTKEPIMLGDCFPLDSQSFEQFKLSGGNGGSWKTADDSPHVRENGKAAIQTFRSSLWARTFE